MRALVFMVAVLAMIAGLGALGLAIWAAMADRLKLAAINAAVFLVNMAMIMLCAQLMESLR